MDLFLPQMTTTLLAALLAFGNGCGRRASDAVVVRVGVLSYSAEHLRRDTEACLSTYLSKAKGRKSVREKETEKIRSRAEARSLAAEINYMLVSSSARGRGLKPSERELKKVKDDYSVSYFGKKGRFEELSSVLPQEDFKVLCDQAQKIAVVNTFADRQYAEKYRVSEQDVATAWTNVVAHNTFADATNACLSATAHDLVRKARAGEDFARLADCYSQDEDKEPGGVVPGLHKEDYAADKPSVWAAISALKPGEVTEPLDSDDGLAIFKLDSVSPCRCSGEESAEEKDYHLRRIVFHRALKYPYETADDLVVELNAQKKKQMWRQVITDLTAEHPLSFPLGFDCFSPDSLLMLRAYSGDVPKPKLNKMENLVLNALKARQQKKQDQSPVKEQETHENHKH